MGMPGDPLTQFKKKNKTFPYHKRISRYPHISYLEFVVTT